MRRHLLRGATVLALWLLLGATLSGCGDSSPTGPSTSLPEPSPVANSPTAAITLLEWCYDHRSIAKYEELFTDDFRWVCSLSDSSVTIPGWAREDELISANHLFTGGDDDSHPAITIRLTLDRPLFATPDPVTPWDATGHWHRRIHTGVDLHVLTVDGDNIGTAGAATFHLVRGDSALIPADLQARGFGPDSARWYIRGWDDATVPQPPKLASGKVPALSADAVIQWSWCQLKSVYR